MSASPTSARAMSAGVSMPAGVSMAAADCHGAHRSGSRASCSGSNRALASPDALRCH
ncbi:hypothetical protein ACWCRD_32390 [Streptomyces sp. NPDC002092]